MNEIKHLIANANGYKSWEDAKQNEACIDHLIKYIASELIRNTTRPLNRFDKDKCKQFGESI